MNPRRLLKPSRQSPPSEARIVRSVKLTPAEDRLWRQRAAALSGGNLAELIRYSVLHFEPTEEDFQPTREDLQAFE